MKKTGRLTPWLLIGLQVLSVINCTKPENKVVPNIKITRVSLSILDTLELTSGIFVAWDIRPEDSLKYTSFSIYSKYSQTSDPLLERVEVDPGKRNIILPLPDTTLSELYLGVEGVYLSETDQEWKSDSILFERLQFLSPIVIYSPKEGVLDSNIKSIFEIQSTHDYGVKYWFFAFTQDYGLGEVLSRPFPFGAGEDTEFIGRNPIRDSLQFLYGPGTDPVPVSWCILSTESPGSNPVGLRQTLTCSRFSRIRP